MPRLSDQMEEGIVLQWIKAEGDPVVRGDPLVEIETDKATWVVEAEADGQLLKILVRAGEAAPVGGAIAVVGVEGEAVEDATETPALEPQQTPETVLVQAPVASHRPGRPRATPVARRTASELRVSLESIAGSGPGGRIVRRDVLAAAGNGQAASGTPDRGPATEVELTPTQRTIARRMVESTTSIPHFFLTAEIDMDAAVALRRDLKELTPERVPSMNDLVVKAAALALRDHRRLNSSFVDRRVMEWARINVGIAVATPDALVVPVVLDADRKPLAEIVRETSDLARRAQERALAPVDLAEGTFTVSNLGMLGIRSFSAVINPPQAAILAVGQVVRRAAVTDEGEIVARHLVEVTLSSDHRVVYGADAARFLARLRELLERPLALTL